MIVTNNKPHVWYLFYTNGGTPKSVKFGPLESIDIPDLTSENQIIYNQLDARLKSYNERFDTDFVLNFSFSTVPTSSNATVQAWIDKISTDGYEYPSQEKVDVYTAAFDYADAEGITTELDLLGLLKVENEDLCKVPFIHSAGPTSRFTLESSPIFTENNGLKTNPATTGGLKTNWSIGDGINYQLGDAFFGLYVNGSSDTFNPAMGSGNNAIDYIYPRVFGGNASAGLQSSGTLVSGSVPTSVGLTCVSIPDNLNMNLYKNGLQIATAENSSPVYSDESFWVCRGSTLGSGYPNNISMFCTGSGSIDQAKLNTFVNMLLL